MRYLFIFLIFLTSVNSYASDLYEIKNIFISSNASDTTKAREIAIGEGQYEGFKVLLRKLNLAANKSITLEEIQDLVRDYGITAEKMSPGRYTGIMSVSFNKIHVDAFLTKLGANSTDLVNLSEFIKTHEHNQALLSAQRKILVLPMIKKAGQIVIWEDDNAWLAAWKEMTPKLSSSEYVVTNGDLEDIRLTGKLNLLSANFSNFLNILAKYNANEVLIAVADLTKDEDSNIYKLSISIKQESSVARNNVLENYSILKGDDLAYLYTQGVESILAGKGNVDRYTDLRAYGSDQSAITVILKINNLSDWDKMESKLKKSELINKYTIKKVALKKYYIDLFYHQSPDELVAELQKLGLSLDQKDGFLTIELPQYVK